jgi:hypothetical protein
MPNWCNNLLMLSGSSEALANFQNKFDNRRVIVDPDEPAREPTKVGLLSAFFPTPEELMRQTAGGVAVSSESSGDQLIQKYGARDWYDWRTTNWGTKWDVMQDGASFDQEGSCLFSSFESAWAPPIRGILVISTLFPDIQFDLQYEEPGCNFEGQFVALAGEVIHHAERPFTEGEALDPDDEDSERECISLEAKFEPFEFHS